jgi:hypothetical protein
VLSLNPVDKKLSIMKIIWKQYVRFFLTVSESQRGNVGNVCENVVSAFARKTPPLLHTNSSLSKHGSVHPTFILELVLKNRIVSNSKELNDL